MTSIRCGTSPNNQLRFDLERGEFINDDGLYWACSKYINSVNIPADILETHCGQKKAYSRKTKVCQCASTCNPTVYDHLKIGM